MRVSLAIFALYFLPAIGTAATIWVPDDYGTIEGAINAAGNGDVVVVRPGTYHENIDFLGKAITVKSEQGADFTVIDGDQKGSAVIFQSGEGSGSRLVGFTITNGSGTYDSAEDRHYGGGIFFRDGSSPEIAACTITSNTAKYGAGLYGRDSSHPAVLDCLISSNAASWTAGGAGFFSDCAPILANCTIIDNTAVVYCGEE